MVNLIDGNKETVYDWKPNNSYFSGGTYKYEWGDVYSGDMVFNTPWYIIITISRILEDSKQNVTGEVAIDLNEQVVHRARLNLTSSVSRRGFIKELPTRFEGLDWSAVIRQACDLTLDKYREGEPMVRLGTMGDIPPLEYIIYPLVLKNAHNVLFGDGGTGKSYIADLIAVLVQYNIAHLGLLPESGNVLFLDWETSRETVERRVEAIKRGLGIEGEAFFYRFCEQPLAYEIELIRQMVIDNNITLVIADSAGMAAGFEGDYHQSATRYARALRSLRITSLSIDHITKTEGDKPFGSVYKHNIARSAYKIKHSQSPGDKDLYIGLYHHKMNDGSKQKPIGFHISFEGDDYNLDRVVFESIKVGDVPELAEGLPLAEQIFYFLKHVHEMISHHEIAESIGQSKDSVRSTLYKMHKKNQVIHLERKWGLAVDAIL